MTTAKIEVMHVTKFNEMIVYGEWGSEGNKRRYLLGWAFDKGDGYEQKGYVRAEMNETDGLIKATLCKTKKEAEEL